MITLRFTQASRFQNSMLSKDFSIPIKKKTLLIGRGEELQETQSQANGIIDLTNFDNTLSRVHASINFSPAWFSPDTQKVPTYLSYIKHQQLKLPDQILDKIWWFIKPKKNCILKDLKKFSKNNFKQVVIYQDNKEMIIEFVHQSFIQFQYCEKYEAIQELTQRIEMIKSSSQKLIIFGDLKKIAQDINDCTSVTQKTQFLKIWRFSIKEIQYVLLIQNNLVLRIGRSSHCQIQIKDTAISRYQAYLKCQQKKWKIYDGNQIEKSKNGTWKKCRSIDIQISTNQNFVVKNNIKIGTIKCEIQLIERFQWLNIQRIVNQDVSKSFIQIGMDNQTYDQQHEKKDQVN